MMAQQWRLLALHDYHLQALVNGHSEEATRWVNEAENAPDVLRSWVAWQLQLPLDARQYDSLPVPYRDIWRGWDDYYRGQLSTAADAFYAAFSRLENTPESEHLRCVAALGLGKVYTRTGHWQAARDWLLLSLCVARGAGRQFEILRGYGALGELLLRAGHTPAAHACMSASYHLLPSGKGQQARQLNYLATTLMRSGEFLRAESLLMSARLSAKDQADTVSCYHALARLQFLRWDKHGADSGHILTELPTEFTASLAPAAAGFIYLGQAMRSGRQSPQAQAITRDALAQAEECFGDALPIERAWVRQQQQRLEGLSLTPDPALLECLALTPYVPSAGTAAVPNSTVLDRTWQQLPLGRENGFAWLGRAGSMPAGADIDQQDSQQQRQCFFI